MSRKIDLANFHNDLMQLSDYLKSLNNPYGAIDKLFDRNNIYLLDEQLTKRQLLDMLIKNLESQKVVTKDYMKKVYEREKMYSTAIGGKIAIPHSLGYATKKSKVSFARLKRPILWDENNEVKYVFLLAISREDYLSIQKLFDFIVDLQGNTSFRQIIDRSKNPQEIKDAISMLIKTSY
ncbi:PTS sugar transporter subunit IIA [Lactobacillus sp. ESL0684]|uniref:PTS sugar transporter subunit IIA n=1 Tax=Lactobacillus sp. ESL0684 TaxID=2983213 RepID=UPI0023F73BFF|nr:PTS sugar transporter subunit IIA [Lactobacillus sp. ESL0684]WEV43848.1 PTS sugar transporter subunit IIA [Lactobacillus sp. ESL0684]